MRKSLNHSLFSASMWLVISLSGMAFWGCQPEDSDPPNEIRIESETNYLPAPCSIEWVCVWDRERGIRHWLYPSICTPPAYTYYDCSIYTKQCFPILTPCFWEPDIFFEDPYKFREAIDPFEIPSFRDMVEFPIDPLTNSIAFRINEYLLGIQHYETSDGLIDEESYFIHTTMEIDEATLEAGDIKGKVLPAGKYPVAFNKKNGTYTAFVTAANYPIKNPSKVGAYKGGFEGSIEELLYKHEIVALPEAQLIELKNAFEIAAGDPSPQPSIYFFTPNQLSLGIQFKGEPEQIKLEGPVQLPEELAAYLDITAFELTPEFTEMKYDQNTGLTTMLFHNSK